MIRRAIVVGLALGLFISVASIYPLLGFIAPAAISGWRPPVDNMLLHGALLMGSAVLAVPAFLLGGALAAYYTRASGQLEGLRMGLLAGATAGSGVFLTLVSPLNALVAYGTVAPAVPRLMAARPLPPNALLRYVAAFDNFAFSLELTLLLFAAVWGLGGLLVGYRQRGMPRAPRPTLFGLVAAGRHPRAWFEGDETAVRVALRVGVAVGLLALITTFGLFYVGFAQNLPEFETIVEESRTGMVTGPLSQALSVLSPLLVLALLTFGIFVVGFIKNPSSRFRARIGATMFAGVIIFTFLSAVGLRIFYFNFGLIPFVISQALQQDAGGWLSELTTFQPILDSMAGSSLLVNMTVVAAWATVGLAVLLGLLVGGLEGILSSLLVPLAAPRPVDRAASVCKQLERDPEAVLPTFYGLCVHEAEAYDILLQVAICTHAKQPGISRLAAAYHTLGTSTQTQDHIQTVDAIRSILQAEPQWRWSADFGAVYGTLHDVLNARDLEQILAVEPPPGQQTGSLPPLMVQSMQHIRRIILELQKTKKVDDLPTQLHFLENGLAAIHAGQRFVQETALDEATAVSLPQRTALADALDHWQGVVLMAIKRLKGRADLAATLQSQLCSHCTPLPLVWEIQNNGLNVAQEVRLRLLPGPHYTLDETLAEIDILPPGEARQVTLAIFPQPNVRRLRVEWEIVYDDAVVDDRRLTFADMVEFEDRGGPFQRVFPIPYVTGTPLKTDDVFVGREDVFAFIRENLLGTYQNNVIILNGQRRTGKTSVLYRLGEVMVDTHYSVLIDMQGKPARSEAEFLYAIADDIVFALEEAGLDVALPPRANFDEAPEFFFRARFLRGIYPHLGDKHLLLMFDEFEELQRRVEHGRLQPEIFPFLRNLMQHEAQIDFVFSGTHRLEDLSAAYWSVLFNIAAYKSITFLSQAEVQRLMSEPVAAFDIEYDPLAAQRIYKVAAGHPYFTQLILHEMMVYHNETERSYLTVADVDQVLEQILERGEAHFKYIWNESSPEEREVLQSAAELLHGADVVDLHDMQRLLNERGRESPDRWRAALTTLRSRDILTRRDAKTTRYRFKVDLVRLWIDRTRPPL